MLFALGAASSALDLISSLTSKSTSSTQSAGQSQAATLFDVPVATPAAAGSGGSSSGGGAQISPETMSALLAAQGQYGTTSTASTSPSDALKDLFSQIDGNGDGSISKSEFEQALGAGGTNLAQADDVFSNLDKNGDGSVSLDEMSSALKGGGGHGHHHHHVASGGGTGDSSSTDGSSSDPLMQALDGATSNSVTNSDGSTTTTMTYADGSKVTMTSAAQAAASGSATSSYNFVEQLIQRQANAVASQASASVSVSA